MSWENPNEKGTWAIALCDSTGFFCEAINCARDGDMGKKDENGVYERIWYGDNIECYGDELDTLRPATRDEVELYLEYVSLEDAVGNLSEEPCSVHIVHKSYSEYVNSVVVRFVAPSWWKRLLSKFNKKGLPF